MTSKHFSDISIERVSNEVLARVLGGTWMVVYKRDGVFKAQHFQTAAVAASFAAKLETGMLDDEVLHPRATAADEAAMLRQQNAELNAVLATAPRARMLAEFAAHAPEEIPAWFDSPALPPLTLPEPHPSIAEEARQWANDPCYDFDAVFNERDDRRRLASLYADAMRAHSETVYARQGEHAKVRYFGWRWHYAEQMVAAGEKAGLA